MHSLPSLDQSVALRSQRPAWRAQLLTNSSELDRMPSAEALIELVEAVARDRDKQAFAMLYRCFAPRLKTWLMREGLGAGPAEDLAQDTLLTVWRKASYYRSDKAGVTTWIFTIARNRRVDHFRRTGNEVERDDDPTEADETALSGETVVMGVERERLVRAALETLAPEQSRIVRLSFFEEKPHSEIAQELGLPLGTVKSRIRLALARLRLLLEVTR
jgi:RNA polymerase sigma-70 factor (ECF subfamily)